MTRMTTFAGISAAVFALCAGLLLVGTQKEADAQAIRIGGYRPRFVIVFLDETGSRGAAWEAMREKAAVVASRLKNKEAFAVIGIDDHGFDEQDVRIPLSVLQAQNDLMVAVLNQQRRALVDRVTKLEPRRHPQSTDIVGAIKQALDMANKESKDRRIVLAFFSDMQQTPKMPDAAAFRGIRFPPGTEAHCYYVAASKKYDFPATVSLWKGLLNSAGVRISENDFHQQGTVDRGIDTAFPQ